MSIRAYQIIQKKTHPIETKAASLDEFTRMLPEGFYTTFSTLSGGKKVLGLRTHLQRLYKPAKNQHITPSVDEPRLRKCIAEFAMSNLPDESRIRVVLTKDVGMVYLSIQPFEPLPRSIYEFGVHVITADMARQSPRIKDTGFIFSSEDERKLVGRDVFEILLVQDKNILEGMTSNFYAVMGNRLITARNGILLGVTRRVVLRLARGRGMSIEYRPLKINETMDESFLTSSSRGVVPIVSIDNNAVGQGRVGKWTKTLSKEYQNYVDEKAELIN
jgi:branched-chain amino acid aminotransferase